MRNFILYIHPNWLAMQKFRCFLYAFVPVKLKVVFSYKYCKRVSLNFSFFRPLFRQSPVLTKYTKTRAEQDPNKTRTKPPLFWADVSIRVNVCQNVSNCVNMCQFVSKRVTGLKPNNLFFIDTGR